MNSVRSTEYSAVISMNMEDQDKLQSHTKQRTKEKPSQWRQGLALGAKVQSFFTP